MRNFVLAIAFIAMGAVFLASCDLQPKITSLPDTVGDFISERYPAMLADPDTEPEIYNSAVADYGVYASPELYGSVGMDDYVNYVGVDDYVLRPETSDEVSVTEPVAPGPNIETHIEYEKSGPEYVSEPVVKPDPVPVVPEPESETEDALSVPEYTPAELHVPARAAAGTVVVRRGDTLYSIARDNDTTVADLAAENNLKSPYTIKVDQILKLPVKPVPVTAVEKTVVAPGQESVAVEPVKPAPVQDKPDTPKSAPDKKADAPEKFKTITVARGDTLYSISRAYSVSVNDLADMNKLSAPYALKAGQKLRVPDVPVTKTVPVASNVTVSATPASQPVRAATDKVPDRPVVKPVEKKPEQKNVTKPNAEKTVSGTVAEKTKAPDVKVPLKTITVARGDTLYSISRAYSVPVNDLAVMNDLRAPFVLNAGQKLRVPDLPVAKTAPVVSNAPAPAKTAKSQTRTADNAAPKTPVKKSEKTVKPADKPDQKQTQKSTAQKTKADTKKPESKQTKNTDKSGTTTQSQKIAARSSSKFTWPVRGTILSHYGAKTGGLYNDGINISAATGTNVVAAENGVVAYAGNEVRGMGNLIIIQHADGWMTVYAHLNSMTVRRGARVNVGQKIGTVGQTGKVTKPQLHFEIRKGTKSYNPTNYLKK